MYHHELLILGLAFATAKALIDKPVDPPKAPEFVQSPYTGPAPHKIPPGYWD